MRSMVPCASSLLLMVMCGCGGMSLDEMKAPGLTVQLMDSDSEEFRVTSITLREIRENEESERTQEEDCPDLSGEPRAFINDVEVPLEGPGGWHSGGGFLTGSAPHCAPTSFLTLGGQLPKAGAEDVTRIRITEGDTTFIAETRGLCGPRSFRMSAPADGMVRSSQEVELEWHPATDVLLIESITLFTKADRYQLSRTNGKLQVEGNRMRLQLPLLRAADAGAAKLSVSGHGTPGLYVAGPTRCEGFAQCRFRCNLPNAQTSLDVTVQAE